MRDDLVISERKRDKAERERDDYQAGFEKLLTDRNEEIARLRSLVGKLRDERNRLYETVEELTVRLEDKS
jgi:hypothetical protein